jgi:glycosyltransferase involved in cell wall biosynthesis
MAAAQPSENLSENSGDTIREMASANGSRSRASKSVVHLIGQLRRAGAEKQMMCTSLALKKRGWQQTVISLRSSEKEEAALRSSGIPVFVIRPSWFKPWRLHLLARLVRSLRPAIAVSWSWHVAVYARWLFHVGPLKRIFNLRENLTHREGGIPARADTFAVRDAFQRSDFVVSNSRVNLDVLAERGFILPPFKVIRNIVESRGRARPAAPVKTPRIIAAGTLRAGKAYDVLLRALGLLARQGADFELTLAGDGPDAAVLEAMAVQEGLAGKVRFPGRVDDVPALLAAAHLAVHPTFSEGLSNTVLEAMAEGLPVVTTAVGGMPEIIRDGQSGLLVPAGDTEALARGIGRLLNDPELRGSLGSAALRDVREHCHETAIAEQYEEVFQCL